MRLAAMPRWGWIIAAAVLALLLLPLYVRWWAYVAGGCPSAFLLQWLPRVG